jgi:multiple sugar transport system substrate-binding protein
LDDKKGEISLKSKRKLSLFLLAIMLIFVPLLQSCSGGSESAGSGSDGNSSGDSKSSGEKVKIKWATWGNPGELTRFEEFTKDYNEKNPNVEVELIPIPGEYEQKIITQLTGGTAPDAFYAGDGTIVKLIENESITELTPLLESPDSAVKPDDFFEGLWGAAKKDGKIYGVTVDDNPMVLWYNKKVLEEAGVTEMPADLYEKGEWNWDTYQGLLDKIRSTGKYGYVLDNWWGHYYSWITSNGGQVYDESGKFVAHENPQAVEALTYLYDNVKNENMTFAGTLPKGQGADAMFMSNQVGFVGAGRWYLPIFKQNKGLEFDIVPWPTNTGSKIEPAGIPTAYMVMNKGTKHPEETFKFISEFVSKDGQIYRLQGGGNAVPSVAGADEVVLEGDLPEHAQFFLDAREVGYALWPEEAGIPGLSADITSEFEALWLKGGSLEDALQQMGEKANKKIEDYKAGK